MQYSPIPNGMHHHFADTSGSGKASAINEQSRVSIAHVCTINKPTRVIS